MVVSAERELTSIGILASHTQRPVRAVEQAATELQIQPALKINGTIYFDGAQVERLTVALNQEQK